MIGKLKNYKFELKDLKKKSYDLEDVNKDKRRTFGEEKNKDMKDMSYDLKHALTQNSIGKNY